ncbi:MULTISPECIES: DNA-deoxyinosine glycosylase [Methanosarcina]|uniref:G:T/U mismatch-specific uracil/thymine DNA-glycosylase n=1 Tax=Methanosarcina vacuolata Z-761 TaxID=1434123 RepID=A0A0E3Q0H5_9EURY|nr:MULTISPECIES: DNA-deoxyinosine glycosylase [Methanosarcina]AKB42608.1 G:T/U mismatch-specific uracil/thymine DNA-glycosylase [Methanosarcina vacuolata Z-761]AKB46099.1 G:T/U mismatch-specific uracil/thymine DNA-glycosylase [Methanosarcina sp. Kolksee]
MKKQGFPAIVDENTEILILGSLPGDISIRKHQYYGHPGNDFWRLLGSIIGEDLQSMDYQNRLETLKHNKIGLWDVFKAGKRQGSEDTKIKDEEINQFSMLKDMAPNLKLVLFNGKKSGEYEPILKVMGYETKVLPSSSGANRRSLQSRKSEWDAAFKR